jgi:GT2 family glycosyltransferase
MTRIDKPDAPSESEVTVSVLIVNWNRQDYIKATLEDLRSKWYPGMEVVVVENGSTDGTPDMIAAEFPEVRMIRLEQNVGQCKGLNIGLREARADVVISLDNDATLQDGSIEKIIAKFRQRPKMAVLHGRIIDFDHRGDVWWWGWYGFPEAEYGQREFPTPWNIAEGLCALRRKAVLEVGGFPEEYFIMAAGRDLAILLIDAGYEIIYTPEVAFFHKAGAEREKTDRYRLHSDRRMYFKLRNELWTLWKYYPVHQAVAKSLMKTVMWAPLMARRGSLACYAQAMVDAYKALPEIARKRKPASRQTIRTVEYSRLRAMKQLRGVMSWYYVIHNQKSEVRSQKSEAR